MLLKLLATSWKLLLLPSLLKMLWKLLYNNLLDSSCLLLLLPTLQRMLLKLPVTSWTLLLLPSLLKMLLKLLATY
jgi:hypothetical protein